MTIEEKHAKAGQVVHIIENPPDAGTITDPDTVLADFVQASDMEVTGTAKELISLWRNSTDKDAFEGLFELLTGRGFGEYLDAAVTGSTPPAG